MWSLIVYAPSLMCEPHQIQHCSLQSEMEAQAIKEGKAWALCQGYIVLIDRMVAPASWSPFLEGSSQIRQGKGLSLGASLGLGG